MGEELICHFGKHEGERMGEIPSGYLRWVVEKITDPRPLPRYQKNDDGSQKTVEEVNQMEADMRNFVEEAKRELKRRDDSGE